jgi:hypothetical protein
MEGLREVTLADVIVKVRMRMMEQSICAEIKTDG